MEEDEKKAKIKKMIKRTLLRKPVMIGVLIFAIIFFIIIISYKVVIDDDTKEDPNDPKNAPGAVRTYLDDVSMDENGNIVAGRTIQELWDEMKANGNRALTYLNSPQELAKLINAQRATEYLDTRKNPDSPIDWTKFNNDVNSTQTQGIIKLKRATSDNKNITMTYVKPETFQKYIDDYNSTGSEKAKENAMKHFTIQESGTGNSFGGSESPNGSADISTATFKSFSKETQAIIDRECRKFKRSNYRKFINSQGGITKYIKSLGGVFTKYGGKNVKTKVKGKNITAGDIKETAEYVWGLASIWGFNYSNNRQYESWTGPGNQFEPHKVGAYNKSNIIENICDNGPRRTNCDHGLNAFIQKLGLKNNFRSEHSEKIYHHIYYKSGKLTDVFKVGDIMHFIDGSLDHVAMVGEVDKAKDKVILYEFGPKFFTNKGQYKWELKVKSNGYVEHYKRYKKHWFAVRPFKDIDQSMTLSNGSSVTSGTDSGTQTTSSTTDSTSSATTSTSTGASGGLTIITTPTVTREEFIKCVKAYTKGQGDTSVFRNNAEIIWEVCVKNKINPVLCAAQARTEGGWRETRASYNYWGLGAFNGTTTAPGYSSMAEGVQAWCDNINERLKGKKDTIWFSREMKKYNSNFTGGINNIYDVLSSYCQWDDHPESDFKRQANTAIDYIDKQDPYDPGIRKCSDCIFGKGKLSDGTNGVAYDTEASDNSGRPTFTAIVATWNEHTDKVSSDDPSVDTYSTTTYTMTTEQIPYQELVSKYTMPFNYLWDYLVLGHDKQFVFDMADLVYNSKFEITVHDNETKTVDVVTDKYTKNTRVKTTGNVTVVATGTYTRRRGQYGESTSTETGSSSATYRGLTAQKNYPHKYTTVSTTIDKNNTLDCALTLADSWFVKYEKKYKYKKPNTTKSSSGPSKLEDKPETLGDRRSGDPGSLEGAIKSEARSRARGLGSGMNNVSYSVTTSNVVTKYYHSIIKRTTGTVTTVTSSSYTASPEKYIEKERNAKEPNFISLLTKYYDVRSSILSAKEWFWDILSKTDSTKNMVDLTKYLFYKVTGTSYGVTEFDFSAYNREEFSSAEGSDGLVGNSVEEKTWFAFRNAGYSEYATAGAMGNFANEEGFKTGGAEDEKYKGSDKSYTEKVVNGTYTREQFSHDGVGYGLCGFTYWTIKQGLYDYAKSLGVRIDDEDMQIKYILGLVNPNGGADGYAKYTMMSKKGYTYNSWKNATSPEEAATAFCWTFERPRESTAHVDRRQKSAREFYNKYHGKTAPQGSSAGGSSSADKIINEANKYVGNPYVWGGSSLTHGCDCSHFVWLVLKKVGVIPQNAQYHTTSSMHSTKLKDWGCTYVGTNAKDAKKGDIIVYSASRIHHTALYMGNGLIVEAKGEKYGITNNRRIDHESIGGIYRPK